MAEMTLAQKQQEFTLMVASLIVWAYQRGDTLTFGEAYRSDEQAEINALGTQGRAQLVAALKTIPTFAALATAIANNVGGGIARSLHGSRLAVDLNLFRGGQYVTDPDEYQPMGEHWESMGGTWGGRFGDANHFSIEHEGRK
jgi:hypothetical protein